MNPRIAAGWGAAVAAALIALPMAARDRLPEPIAVHWGPGLVPDGTASFGVFVAAQAAVWVVIWLFALVGSVRGAARRSGRAGVWALLAGGGLFVLGICGMTLLANLDAASWTEARLPLWSPALAVVPIAAALLAGYFGRGGPDAPGTGQGPPTLRLRAGQQAVWVSRVSNPWLLGITGVAAAGLFAAGVLQLVGVGVSVTALFPVLLIVLVIGLLTSSLRVRITAGGVAIGFGPLGWPVRRISLSKIEQARSEPRFPSQVGGWGVRGLPGGTTIMLRGGDCLVLRYHSGGELAVSIDDAERGASLINALVAERTAA